MYAEKMEVIRNILHQVEIRLQKTGLVELFGSGEMRRQLILKLKIMARHGRGHVQTGL